MLQGETPSSWPEQFWMPSSPSIRKLSTHWMTMNFASLFDVPTCALSMFATKQVAYGQVIPVNAET